MLKYKIRIGDVNDLPFLKRMLYEAVFWDPAIQRIPAEELFAVPDIAKILHEWYQREGDFALIALDDQNNWIGSVCYRFWTDDNHVFGYIDENTPEIGIAVLQEYRGKGIGTRLMNETIQHAKNNGIKKLSLSVDPNNFALKLYQKLGFKKVSESGTSWTLVKKL